MVVSSAEAILRLALIGGMLLVFVGGLVAILMVWYVRGRDPHTGLVADILPEPPDDLSPGSAGTLLDEHAGHEDVVATLVGLGRNGAVTMTMERGEWTITALHPDRITSRVERDLLNLLFDGRPEPLREVSLNSVRPRFVAAEARIRDDLYGELVEQGYFPVSPVVTRRRWRRLSWAGIVASALLGVLGAALLDPWALGVMVAGVIVWAVMLRMSRHMPRKTDKGAEAAARWRAFRRYLEDIGKHRELGASTEVFERYLAYAIAFRIDREWIRAFSAAGARRPSWLGGFGDVGDVVIIGGEMTDVAEVGELAGGLGRLTGDMSLPDVNLPDVGMPDVQGLSDMLGTSLQGASDGLSGLLDSAGSIFDAIDFDL